MTSHSDVIEEPIATFDDVMIDIETMPLHPHNALILSIGMLEFDPSQIGGLRTGARCLITPDIEDQILLGRRVDVGTQDFWHKQSSEARDHWLHKPRYDLPGTINLVRQFCVGRTRVWANGTQFDLSNLVGLSAQVSGEPPLWHLSSAARHADILPRDAS